AQPVSTSTGARVVNVRLNRLHPSPCVPCVECIKRLLWAGPRLGRAPLVERSYYAKYLSVKLTGPPYGSGGRAGPFFYRNAESIMMRNVYRAGAACLLLLSFCPMAGAASAAPKKL